MDFLERRINEKATNILEGLTEEEKKKIGLL